MASNVITLSNDTEELTQNENPVMVEAPKKRGRKKKVINQEEEKIIVEEVMDPNEEIKLGGTQYFGFIYQFSNNCNFTYTSFVKNLGKKADMTSHLLHAIFDAVEYNDLNFHKERFGEYMVLVKVDDITVFSDSNNYNNYENNYTMEQTLDSHMFNIFETIIKHRNANYFTFKDKEFLLSKDFEKKYKKDSLNRFRITIMKVPIGVILCKYDIKTQYTFNSKKSTFDIGIQNIGTVYYNTISNYHNFYTGAYEIDPVKNPNMIPAIFQYLWDNIQNRDLFNDVNLSTNTRVKLENEYLTTPLSTYFMIAESWRTMDSLTVEDFIPATYLIIKNKTQKGMIDVINHHFMMQSRIIPYNFTDLYVSRNYLQKLIHLVNLIGNANLSDGILKFKLDYANNKIIFKFHKKLLQQIVDNKVILSTPVMKKLFNSEDLQNYPIEDLSCLKKYHTYGQNMELTLQKANEDLNSANPIKSQFANISLSNLIGKINNVDCLFEYQKDNIKWMKFLENKVNAKELAITTNIKYDTQIRRDSYQIVTINGKKYINNKLPFKDEKWSFTKPNPIVGPGDVYRGNVYQGTIYEFSDEHLKYYMTNNLGLIPYEDFVNQNQDKIYFQGGILCDDVGLGKTLSMICHIINNLEEDRAAYFQGKFETNNLIILPNRLMTQWRFELDKFVNSDLKLRVYNIMSISDIKKLAGNNISQYDIILMCKNLIINDKYTDYLKECLKLNADKKKKTTNPPNSTTTKSKTSKKKLKELESIDIERHNKLIEYFDLYNIKFNRIIVDEAHEILHPEVLVDNSDVYDYYPSRSYHNSKSADELMMNNLYQIKSNYKWGLTATPFNIGYNNFIGILKFLSQPKEWDLTIPNEITEKNKFDVLMKLAHKYNLKSDLTNSKKLTSSEFEIVNTHFSMSLLQKTFIEYDPYLSILGMPGNQVIKLYTMIMRQTLKNSVRDEIKIPVFTEKIINLDLSDVEKNLYATMNSHSNHYTEKYLFKLCTNLLIMNYFNSLFNGDSHVIDDDLDQVIPNIDLNKLQEYMVAKLKEVFKKQEDKLKSFQNSFDARKEKIEIFQKAIKYLEENCGDNIKNENNVISHFHLEREFTNYLETAYHFYKDDVKFLDFVKEDDNIYQLYTTHRMQSRYNKNTIEFLMHHSFKKLMENTNRSLPGYQKQIDDMKKEMEKIPIQIALFQNQEYLQERTTEPCIICYCEMEKFIITKCRHIFCWECFHILMSKSGSTKIINCPECRSEITENDVTKSYIKSDNNDASETNIENQPGNVEVSATGTIKLQGNWKKECINKYGSKMSVLVEYLATLFENPTNRVIIFSQYHQMLKLIGQCLASYKIKHVFCMGNVYTVNKNIDSFKRDPSIRVIMLSSESCNSGNNLTEANHVIFVDVLNHPKKTAMDIEKQAIGRTVRLGQKQPVLVTRLITNNTVESAKYNENKYDIASLQ